MSTTPLLREADEPLGLFFSPGRADHQILKQLLSENKVGFNGAVFDPCHCSFQEELRSEMCHRNLDAILDTRMMELATPGGHTPARRSLPWADAQPHVPSDFSEARCEAMAALIADFVVEKGFTAVLAPCHFLRDGAQDPWFRIDKRLTSFLRQRLDSNRCQNVAIHYPLAVPIHRFLDSTSRFRIKESLESLNLNSIWLRIHPFGSDSGDIRLQHVIQACRQFHFLQIPLLAERAGILGLALLAFGAVAGLQNGISSGESFDFGDLKRPPKTGPPFGRPARIYVSELGVFLTRSEARQFFQNRGLRHFACRDTACCHDGYESMIQNPRRHFAYRRMVEVALLNGVPPSMRPSEYLDRILRPATDHIGRALSSTQLPDSLKAKLERARRKQDGWRETLGTMSRSPTSISVPIERRIKREVVSA